MQQNANHCTGSKGRAWIVAALLGAISIGSVQGATRHVPAQYPTIQAAVDASASRDTVMIAPGIYRGPGNKDITFSDRDVIVTSSAGPEETVIDCEGSGRGFYIGPFVSTAARVENLTIRNGNVVSDGGGIYCGAASPTIRNCRIHNCHAAYGGGMYLSLYDGLVDGCVVSANFATRGGGGIATSTGFRCTIRDCVVSGNVTARSGGGLGLGNIDGDYVIGCTISGNSSSRAGGGISAPALFLNRSIVWGNCAATRADQIYISSTAQLSCSDVDSSGVFNDGSGIFYDEDCIFEDPVFCGPIDCGQSEEGDYSLSTASPCLPEHSPCGQRIGAREAGCGGGLPTGACCLSDGTCLVLEEGLCQGQHGTYQGNEVPCEPNPCVPNPVDVTSWGRIKTTFR